MQRSRSRRRRAGKKPDVDVYRVAVQADADEVGILRARAAEVRDFDRHLRVTTMRMVYLTASDPNCLGLAAPQIGVSLRIFTLRMADRSVRVFVNPVLTPRSSMKVTEFEGCFSIPNVRVRVERFVGVEIDALDENGSPVGATVVHQQARAAQHELDHLDGKLISDHGALQPIPGDTIIGPGPPGGVVLPRG